MENRYYNQVVVNPGSKKDSSLWDSGDFGMTIQEWKEHINFKQPHIQIRKIRPLQNGVQYT